MPFYLLLAMQAAGMVVDYFGVKNQAMFSEMGFKVQQAGIEANIQQTRLETEDASLQAMQKLRQALGSQIAAFAARGTSTGAGSALNILGEGISNFNADERLRRLNLFGKENQLKGGLLISRLNYMSGNSQLWQGFASRSINRFGASSFSSQGGGSNPYGGSRSEGFGMTKIGS